ncbi:MAG: geranylgeranyl reductase family protein, partial [Candidatus Heimdallarchaeaceae archaeon]
MKKDDLTHVIIVGAGPAGLSLAISLGKKKISAILIEKKKTEEIGYKPCGDALSIDSVKKIYEKCGIAEPSEEIICEKLETAHFASEGKFDISIPFVTQTIDRHKYGQELLATLKKHSSVKILTETKVVEPIIEEERVVGCKIITKNGEKKKLYANVVVDCSGVTGVIRKHLKGSAFEKIQKTFKRTEIIVSCREIIETPEVHKYQKQMRIESHPELPHPGYFWIFAKGEKRLNIGVGWLINENNKKYKPCEVLGKIRKKIFPECKIIHSNADLLPGRLPLHSLVANGFITCGDAGALVNPISGEGHGPALLSGYYASEVIDKAISRNEFTER